MTAVDDERKLEKVFIDAMQTLNRIYWCVDDCVPKDQAYIDSTYAKVVKAFDDLPACRLRTAYAKTVRDGPRRLYDGGPDGRNPVMSEFITRCTEFRHANGTALLTGGRLTQIEVRDGNYYTKLPRENMFEWGGRADGKRIPISEETVAVFDFETILEIIQSHGIFGYKSTWKGALDTLLLYQLLDDGSVVTARIMTMTSTSPLFELTKFDDAIKRACIMSCNTTGASPHLETELRVSGDTVLRGLFPIEWKRD